MPINRRKARVGYPTSVNNQNGPHSCSAERWYYRLVGRVTFIVSGAKVSGDSVNLRRYTFDDGSILTHLIGSKVMMWSGPDYRTGAFRAHP